MATEQGEQTGSGGSTATGFFGFLQTAGQAYLNYDLQSKQIEADQQVQTGTSYAVANGDGGGQQGFQIFGMNAKTVLGNVALTIAAVWAVRKIIKM